MDSRTTFTCLSCQATARLLEKCIKQLKILPNTLHAQLAGYCLSSLDHPLHTESGAATSEQIAAMTIWFAAVPCIEGEDNARVYEECVNRLFQLIYDEDEKSIHAWWSTFWSFMAVKAPEVAAEHSAQFLYEIIDQKQTTLASLVLVSSTFYLLTKCILIIISLEKHHLL